MAHADSSSKYYRILDMYLRLLDGDALSKKEEARRYGINERSVQRDLDDLKGFLAGQQTEGFHQALFYDRKRKGFILQGSRKDLSREEALATAKILLESRAFTKEEMEALVDKIIRSAVSRNDVEDVEALVNNEKRYYGELCHHDGHLLDKIWSAGEAIGKKRLISMTYVRHDGKEVARTVRPLGIMFSEFYFYLIAEFANPADAGLSESTYRFPTVFRMDRIVSFQLGEPFRSEYKERFQGGEVRRRIQYMFGGDLTQVVFRYTGTSAEYILDRLPTAEVIRKEKKENGQTAFTIKAEVYGTLGIRIWFLSQGAQVKVLSPSSLADNLKQEFQKALSLYEEG